MIRLSLPYPPSVWDMYHGWGKTRRLSSEYAKWREDCGYYINRAGGSLTVPFVADIALRRPNKRHDIDNRAKPILDALQHYGIIKNDNQCERLTMVWDQGMKDECVVIIQEYTEAMAA